MSITLFCYMLLQEDYLLRVMFVVDIPSHHGQKMGVLRVKRECQGPDPNHQQADTLQT